MTLTSNTTINALAFKTASNPSAVATASFTKSQIAKGATYWVSPAGTSANGCVNSATQPSGNQNLRQIQDFRFCMAPGDTAMFIPGSYSMTNYEAWDLPRPVAPR